LAKFDLKEYARRGATARVSELKAELAEIYRAFPDLSRARANAIGSGEAVKAGDGRTRAARAARLASATGSSPVTASRRRRMSPAARKAVSERMRKYWAQRRKAKSASK
jgi:hypothetical protein